MLAILRSLEAQRKMDFRVHVTCVGSSAIQKPVGVEELRIAGLLFRHLRCSKLTKDVEEADLSSDPRVGDEGGNLYTSLSLKHGK